MGIRHYMGGVALAGAVALTSFASPARSVAQAPRNGGNPWLVTVGPGLVAGAFSSGVSLNAGAVIRATRQYPIYAGIDTILTVGSNYSYLRYGYYDARYGSSIGFGLLGTGYYNFTFPKKPKMHILGGLSLGPYIGGGYFSLALLMRPGFTYDLTPTISVTGEPLFGVVGGGFVFMPRGLFLFRI